MRTERSEQLYAVARMRMPGGVSSPVRAFGAVGGTPRFIARGRGAILEDVDGNRYIDYVGSWGALILGHAHPAVVRALREAIRRGTSYGAPTEAELELALRIQEAFSSIQKIRFVNSGTEATMSALRVARAATGRSKIIKFEGGYHGHADFLLARAGSGLATFGLPDSAGVPEAWVRDTLVAPYNDLDAVAALFEQFPDQIAAVIVEPVAGNMGVVPPKPGFLEGLRSLTRRYGALLIFDEVITGFRVAWGGAQTLYEVEPDLTCLGKIIGGGLPVGAYGGRADLMDQVAPAGPVYQAGTLSGNPLSMIAGRVTLEQLTPALYQQLEERSAALAEGLQEVAEQAGVPVHIHRVGSMLSVFFTERAVVDYATAASTDRARYARFFHAMLERGIYLPPSPLEAWFVSAAHTEAHIERTLRAARAAFREVARGVL
ncbi:glutamate-1-semialdehyde 2,1-aminomutase [Thermoflexus sp.]|uniref:glutamate-1-semialdehyde 2,1-aminomutase n=1 Tax=Thermoflexus sp. TaxID=1969742 RepID=UPI0035E42E40